MEVALHFRIIWYMILESECNANTTHCIWNSDRGACQENDAFEAAYKDALKEDPATTLNIYSGELGGTLGYAYLPTDLTSLPLNMDGVVLHYSTLQGINDSNYPYNEGDN